MSLKIGKVEVWAGDIVNKPGMLARVLEALAAAGASLEFVVARRVSENTGRVFVAPLTTAKQRKAAADVGLVRAARMNSLRIEGPDKPGLGARLTRAIADAGINVRGCSAAALGKKSVCYLAFASEAEAQAAAKVVRRAAAAR
jgi:UTP:GlnB (protein PII) uridylyltransferase